MRVKYPQSENYCIHVYTQPSHLRRESCHPNPQWFPHGHCDHTSAPSGSQMATVTTSTLSDSQTSTATTLAPQWFPDDHQWFDYLSHRWFTWHFCHHSVEVDYCCGYILCTGIHVIAVHVHVRVFYFINATQQITMPKNKSCLVDHLMRIATLPGCQGCSLGGGGEAFALPP